MHPSSLRAYSRYQARDQGTHGPRDLTITNKQNKTKQTTYLNSRIVGMKNTPIGWKSTLMIGLILSRLISIVFDLPKQAAKEFTVAQFCYPSSCCKVVDQTKQSWLPDPVGPRILALKMTNSIDHTVKSIMQMQNFLISLWTLWKAQSIFLTNAMFFTRLKF